MQVVRRQAGDTIIEVMFAFAIFASVVVGTLAIMNQGTGTAERSLEISLVRQQMNAQAEALRFVQQAYIDGNYTTASPPASGSAAATWLQVTNSPYIKSQAVGAGLSGNTCTATGSSGGSAFANSFVLNIHSPSLAVYSTSGESFSQANPPPYSQVVYNVTTGTIQGVYGIWIEAVPSTASVQPNYIDFRISACWSAPGGNVPVTLGTIVRLYEPAP